MRKETLEDIVINMIGMVAVIASIFFISSCSEDTFVLGYNKDLEKIYQSTFEVDSLIMTIQMNLDSLNATGLNK